MGTGTEVTRVAAVMILTGDNFSIIVRAVQLGRGLYDNLTRYIRFQIGGPFGYIVTFLGASIFNVAEGIPLRPLQTLWVNFTMLSIQSVGSGYSKPAAGLMERLPLPPSGLILTRALIVWLALLRRRAVAKAVQPPAPPRLGLLPLNASRTRLALVHLWAAITPWPEFRRPPALRSRVRSATIRGARSPTSSRASRSPLSTARSWPVRPTAASRSSSCSNRSRPRSWRPAGHCWLEAEQATRCPWPAAVSSPGSAVKPPLIRRKDCSGTAACLVGLPLPPITNDPGRHTHRSATLASR